MVGVICRIGNHRFPGYLQQSEVFYGAISIYSNFSITMGQHMVLPNLLPRLARRICRGSPSNSLWDSLRLPIKNADPLFWKLILFVLNYLDLDGVFRACGMAVF